jgi:hypothetical protein
LRSRALDYLNHVVRQQKSSYTVTIPAALYVAASLTDPRIAWTVDKRPATPSGPCALSCWAG